MVCRQAQGFRSWLRSASGLRMLVEVSVAVFGPTVVGVVACGRSGVVPLVSPAPVGALCRFWWCVCLVFIYVSPISSRTIKQKNK